MSKHAGSAAGSRLAVLLVFCMLIVVAGCAGGMATSVAGLPGGSSGSPDLRLLSSLTETFAQRFTVDAATGGTFTLRDLELYVPPGSMDAGATIELSCITILDGSGVSHHGQTGGHGLIYKLASADTGRVITFSSPCRVTVRLSSALTAPALAEWDGEAWQPLDEEFIERDDGGRTLTTYLDYLDEDVDAWEVEGAPSGGSVEKGPTTVTAFPDIALDSDLTHRYAGSYKTPAGNFALHYDSNVSAADAVTLGDAFERCRTFYVGAGYNAPVNFQHVQAGQSVTSSRVMVYLRTDAQKGAWASHKGVIYLPAAGGLPFQKSTAFHELFHLVQFSHTKRNDITTWFAENTAESMGPYAYNQLEETGVPRKYDLNPANGGVFWDGLDLFQTSLDYARGQQEYYNAVIWLYLLAKQGAVTYRDVVIASMNADDRAVTLDDVSTAFASKAGVSLQDFWSDAFSDYYVLGVRYNKTLFNNFPSRPSGMPLCNSQSGFAGDLVYDAFSSANPYAESTSVRLPRLSGRYWAFSRGSKTGSLELTVAPGATQDFVVRAFSYAVSGGSSTLVSQQTWSAQALANVLVPWSGGATHICVLLENRSLTRDNVASVQIQGRE